MKFLSLTTLSAVAAASFSFVPASVAQSPLNFQPGVTRVAGTGVSGTGGANASALLVKLHGPKGVVQDAQGNIYFTDTSNNMVDRVDAQTGALTIVAGGGTACAGATDASGDGCVAATQTVLNAPQALAMDVAGNLYVAEFASPYLIHEINMTTGMMMKIAGGGTAAGVGQLENCTGSTDTVGDGCLATVAAVNEPAGLAIDAAGNIFESEFVKESVRRIDGKTGIIGKWAGTGSAGSIGDGGVGTSAKIYHPSGLVLDSAANLFIAEYDNDLVRKVTSADIISTLAGINQNTSTVTPTPGYTGDGSVATTATLNLPTAAAAALGNVFLADSGNNVVRVVNSSKIISTYAGAATAVCTSGDTLGNNCVARQAMFAAPYGIFADSNGGLLLADTSNNEIRRIALGNDFGSVAVNASAAATREAFVQAMQAATITSATTATGATEFAATGLVGCTLNVALTANASCGVGLSFMPKYPGLSGTVLTVTPATGSAANLGVRGIGLAPAIAFGPAKIATFAGTGTAGLLDSTTATSAKFSANAGIAVDSSQSLYIADTANNAVRRIDGASGAVTTVVAASAGLNAPAAVATDYANARVLIADTGNHAIRALNAQGAVTTIAGTPGTSGTSGDGGAAAAATLHSPGGVTADNAGIVYIADTANNVIRKVDPSGTITTIAGTGASTYTGDGSAATAATLSGPTGLATDVGGNLYIADTGNHAVRKITMSTGVITTVAGTGLSGYTGDNASATLARLNAPRAVAVDAAGNLLIADTGNSVARFVLAASGVITTIAGTGTSGYSGDGSSATVAKLASPAGIAADGAGNVFVSDTANDVIRSVPRATAPTLTYGAQAVGTTSAAQTVSVVNPGNRPLTFSSIVVTAPFALSANASGDCSTSTPLAAGAACTVSVVFSPTSTGSSSGSLTLMDNSLNTTSTQTIPLVFVDSPLATSTTIAFAPTATPAVYGETVTLTATITEKSANMNAYTGSVVFSDGVTQVGSATPNSSGLAVYSYIPAVGTHSYSASFVGDSGHDASQSATTSALTITKATTQIQLGASSLSPRIATNVTLTATIVPQVAGTPTGTVTFSANGVALSPVANVVNGVASLTLSTLPVGANAITATYSGDGNFTGSNQSGLTVTVVIVPDFAVTATPAALTIPSGQSGVVNLALTPSYGYTGTISFSCGTLPANVACRFLPASLTTTGANTPLYTELLITTGGSSASQNVAQLRLGFVLLGLPWLLLSARRRKLRTGALAMFVLMAGLTAFLGCSSHTALPATAAAGTTSVVVTETGSMTHTTTINLTIQ